MTICWPFVPDKFSVVPLVVFDRKAVSVTPLAVRFVPAKIAGHSSITITQRYVHPQADAINRVFNPSQFPVGTNLSTTKKLPKPTRRKKLRRNSV